MSFPPLLLSFWESVCASRASPCVWQGVNMIIWRSYKKKWKKVTWRWLLDFPLFSSMESWREPYADSWERNTVPCLYTLLSQGRKSVQRNSRKIIITPQGFQTWVLPSRTQNSHGHEEEKEESTEIPQNMSWHALIARKTL